MTKTPATPRKSTSSHMAEAPRMLPVVQSTAGEGKPPIFEKVAIAGLGLIGGSIALAARQHWPTALVIGLDRSEVLEKAMLLHAIDIAASDPVVIADADLIILAAPIEANIGLLGGLEGNVVRSAVVTDVGSTKRATVDAARQLPSRLSFVGGHPLGGAPRSGIEHARPDLFVDRPWVFTPEGAETSKPLERLCDFVEVLGAKPQVMSPLEHDRQLAMVSHLPQLTVSALMHVVGTAAGVPGLKLTGRGFFDTTRLASSSADIWQDICRSNADQIRTAIDVLITQLESMQRALDKDDDIARTFNSAGEWRERLVALRPPKPTA